MHIYDYIIIGSGLTGLTVATRIKNETENILVLEAQDVTGGDNRPATLNEQVISNGLRFMPATEASEKAVAFLEELLGEKAAYGTKNNGVETYEASGFKKFAGFGEKSPEFYDQLSYFLSADEMQLASAPHHWTAVLSAKLGDCVQKRSIVTKFGFEGLDSERPQLTHVVVNGGKQIYARNFIFTGNVKDLGLLIPDDVLSLRAKAKLKKSATWQGVCLDLYHEVKIEKENLFLLNGTTDDELGPCIGRFLPAVNENGQVSQWMSFIDSEYAEDTENIGLVLKKIKRQIKRAFPELADTLKKERIFVTPALSGADLKLSASGTLPKVENLWIGSSPMGPYRNLLGSLMRAQMILSALGFVTGLDIPDIPDMPVLSGESAAEAEL